MKKIGWFVLFGLAFYAIAGCVARPQIAPPPLKPDVRPPSPGPGFVWIEGYWRWAAGEYHWVPGQWARAEAGRTWIPGHWQQRGRRWVWIPGRWTK